MYRSTFLLSFTLCIAACDHQSPIDPSDNMNTTTVMNPLAAVSTLPFQAPPFDKLNNEVYKPAIEAGMAKQLEEVKAIATNEANATFENTIEALEKSGQDLSRVMSIFYGLTGSNTNDTLQEIKAEMAPRLTAHQDAMSMDPVLFARIKAVHDQLPTLGLDPISERLVKRYYTKYVRNGALLTESDKEILRKVNEELSQLSTKFSDNVLEEVKASAVMVDDVKQLEGLTDVEIAAAAEAAKAKGEEGKWLIALRNTTQQPPLVSLKNRELRERIYKASIARNSQSNPYDNRDIIRKIAKLRAQKAKMLGFISWASYVTDDQMAKTPEAAIALLTRMAPAAARNAKAEATKLQAMIDKQGGGFQLAAWDWDYYSEQVRKAEYDLDEAAIKPYLEFETVLQNGVLYSASKLYGLTFKDRHDLPVYHPDVRVFDIIGEDGKQIGLFYGDYYARDNKRGGAWMSSFVDQTTLLGQQPVITQNCNYLKPAAGQPCLLSFDDVTTLFHEFGHALHGMLSQQKYPYFSGTATSRDFVEYPSQVNENWVLEPEVFQNFAKHFQTGGAMPKDLEEKLRKSSKFNQGYSTSEYLAAALLDQEWNNRTLDAPEVKDVEAYEQATLKKHGLDNPQVPPRYKTCYFSHSWGGYSANYYAYIWSEVMDADTYAWFNQHGGMTRENGEKLRKAILSVGGSVDESQMFRDLVGRDPKVEPLLGKRGLN